MHIKGSHNGYSAIVSKLLCTRILDDRLTAQIKGNMRGVLCGFDF